MKKLLLLILSFNIFLLQGSIIPPIMDTAIIRQKVERLIEDPQVIRFHEYFFESITFVNDSVVYYNPQGTLHLFELKFGDSVEVKKLSKSIYHGHNFGRYNFIYDSTFYSFGGSGLFGTNKQLIAFFSDSQEWHPIKIDWHDQKIDKIVFSWLLNDSLNVMISELESVGLNKKYIYTFGKIDLNLMTFHKKMSIESSGIYDFSIYPSAHIYENENYLIINKDRKVCKYYVINKSNGSAFITEKFYDISCIDGKSSFYLIGNILYFRSSNGAIDSASLVNDKVLSIDIPLDFTKLSTATVSSRSWRTYAFIGLIGGVILILFLVLRKRRSTINEFDPLAEIEVRLIKYKNQVISRDTLDTCLGIGHLSADSMKSQRSILIRKINDESRLTIDRQRNHEDKRYFEYRIS